MPSSFSGEHLNSIVEELDKFLATNIRWAVVEEPFDLQRDQPVFILKGSIGPHWERLQALQFPMHCEQQRYFVTNLWPHGRGELFVTCLPNNTRRFWFLFPGILDWSGACLYAQYDLLNAWTLVTLCGCCSLPWLHHQLQISNY